jgi:hypothetical protein
LPNGNFILFYHVHYSFNFGLIMVQFNVRSFREKLYKVQSAFSDKAVIIAHEIDRLTEHRVAESVPRAVASVASEVGYWREPSSLPLAALILRGAPFQCREL